MFQSSPGRLTGCNLAPQRLPTRRLVFQSSPGRLTGCNRHRLGFAHPMPICFNPHPVV